MIARCSPLPQAWQGTLRNATGEFSSEKRDRSQSAGSWGWVCDQSNVENMEIPPTINNYAHSPRSELKDSFTEYASNEPRFDSNCLQPKTVLKQKLSLKLGYKNGEGNILFHVRV